MPSTSSSASWRPFAVQSLSLILALGLLTGCASTDVTRSSATTSAIQTPAQAVAFLASLNSLKMDLTGSVSKDLNPCHPDEAGLRAATFLKLVYTEDLPNGRLPTNYIAATGYKFGHNPINLPSKVEFESKHKVALRSARYELVTLRDYSLIVHYQAEAGVSIFQSAPESLGEPRLQFKDVARLVTKSYPQGRGRIQFFNESGTHLGSLFFQDADFAQLADIQASLLVLCPNVK